ncbi:hypothetical protein BDP27DRAFT_1325480 [Rhodocollybia butyracea]|uniref:Uncharacterized protein n=1 Tax=Rhodocollybia butyracea TaxID=206335 RepID=A0A9P5PUD0_9AGAR|nr:hypothetical protein BDP27DRAFT_1325480 [Rhodocollybia butyracea]
MLTENPFDHLYRYHLESFFYVLIWTTPAGLPESELRTMGYRYLSNFKKRFFVVNVVKQLEPLWEAQPLDEFNRVFCVDILECTKLVTVTDISESNWMMDRLEDVLLRPCRTIRTFSRQPTHAARLSPQTLSFPTRCTENPLDHL